MSKIYEKFNDINAGDVSSEPMHTSEIEHYYSNFKSKNSNKKTTGRFKQRRYILALAAAVILLLSPLLMLNQTIQAQVSQFLEELNFNLTDVFSEDASRYTVDMNQTIEYEDIGIRITDLMVGDEFIIYSFHVELPEGAEGARMMLKAVINDNITATRFTAQVTHPETDGNIESTVITQPFTTAIPDGELSIEIFVEELFFFYDNGNERVHYYDLGSFHTTASSEPLKKDTQSITLDQTVYFGDDSVHLNSFNLSPIDAYFSLSVEPSDERHYILLTDEKGLEYYFIENSVSQNRDRSYAMLENDYFEDENTGDIQSLNEASELTVSILKLPELVSFSGDKRFKDTDIIIHTK